MSRKRTRRANFTAVEKVAIVREHLLEGVPISDLCDRHGHLVGEIDASGFTSIPQERDWDAVRKEMRDDA